jgi:hypothetical protein
MGYYINQNSNGVQLPPRNKADYLILGGAIEIPKPKEFVENLVCVIENGPFDAALYCYKKSEMDEVKDPQDFRPKRWLICPNAAKLSGYSK